jgi:ATP-dependent DNA helicase RecQ
LLQQEEEKIREKLKRLTAFQMIEYLPQNDAPYIIYKRDRIPTENLTINLQLYKKRQDAFIERVKKIISYTTTKHCRSIFINQYFGDASKESCGICDNCLQLKSTGLSAEEFEKIKTNIHSVLTKQKISSSDLLVKLNGINKEKARSVLNFLQAEQKISINEKGEISFR